MTPIDADVCTETAYGLYSVAEDSLDEREERVDALRYKLDWNTNPMSTLTLNMICKTEDGKTKEIKQRLKPMDATIKAEVGGKISWGGSDGTTASGYVKGSIQDNSGNYVRGEITQDSSGQGNASVAGGVIEQIDTGSSSSTDKGK